jgi:DNA polymerase III gamma/tau subunit
VEEASDAGADMQVLIRSLIAGFRNLLVARVDPELLARDLAPEDAKAATERAQGVGQQTTVRALRVLSDAASLARTGGSPRLELETALLRFILESDEGIAPPSRPAAVEKAPTVSEPVIPSVVPAPPKPEAAKPAPKPKSDGPVTVQKLRAAWTNIRGKVESSRPPLRMPLSGAMVDAIDGNAAVVKLRTKLDVDILKDHVKLLEDAINDVLGSSLKVRLEAGAAPPPQNNDEPKQFNEPESADELFGYANERIK